jgi:chromosome segregation ATPase
MSTAPTERLDAIRVELSTILEAKVSELMTTMRQSEELTRRILASELEASRAKNLREDLEAQTEAVQQDLDALHASAEQVQETHRNGTKERDDTRDELSRMEIEIKTAHKEVQDNRLKVRALEKEGDSLSQENMELKIKLRALDDNVGRMRQLRDELLNSIGQLSEKMGALGTKDD